MKKKIASAQKVLMQIKKLSNIKKRLFFQAMRQLYIVCISLVADYEVSIWWDNQNYYYYYSLNKDASDSRLDIYLTKSEFN